MLNLAGEDTHSLASSTFLEILHLAFDSTDWLPFVKASEDMFTKVPEEPQPPGIDPHPLNLGLDW